MKKLIQLGVNNHTPLNEKYHIILSNQIAIGMSISSVLWIIAYSLFFSKFILIPIICFIISVGIIGLNIFEKTKLSRVITATFYPLIIFITHGVFINTERDFFIPIYVVLISFSLFSWNLFSQKEKTLLHGTFILNIFLICGQNIFNTHFIVSHDYVIKKYHFLDAINYTVAVGTFYYLLHYSFKKLYIQSLYNEKIKHHLEIEKQENNIQQEELLGNKYRIEQQQKHIQKQHIDLQNHITILEKTKKLLTQKEAEAKSINKAIYDNFLIAEYDLEGKIIYANQNLLNFIGLPKEELIHHQQDKVSHLDLNTEIEHQIQFIRFWTQIRKGQSLTKEHKFELPHKTIWFQSTFAPLIDENGNTLRILSINHDISHIKRQQFHIKKKNETLMNHSNTLIELSKNENIFSGNWDAAIEKITEQISSCLGIHRVSIWKYNIEKENISCEKIFLSEENKYEKGVELFGENFPNYFDALHHEKIIIANNVLTNDDTKEFNDVYSIPLNIQSLLDIPIFYETKLWGVICCEHKYEERKWQAEEVSFIKSCADLVSLSISSFEQKEKDLQLQIQQQEILIQNHVLIHQKEELLTQRENIAHQKIIIEDKNKKLLDSINYSKRIQDAILPNQSLFQHYFKEYFILYEPKDIISGDVYWLKKYDGQLFLAAIDCTGHGVPGALMSLVANNALNRTLTEFNLTTPGDILKKANEIISTELNQHNDIEVYDGMDICLVKIDFVNRKIIYSGAFNPLYIIENNELIEIKADRKSIGFNLDTDILDFQNHEIELTENQTFYLFSDGFADQFGGKQDKKFSYKRLKKLLLSIENLSLIEQEKVLKKSFDEWKSDYEQIDDVLIIGIRV